MGRLPCELVIARSNEDILWSRNVANCTLTTVYNKARCSRSGEVVGCAKRQASWRSAQLPNVGRESHTFLHHKSTVYGDDEYAPL